MALFLDDSRQSDPLRIEPTAEQRAELIRRYNNAETLDALSKELGRSDAWLRTRFTRWGVHIRSRSEAQLLRQKQHRERVAAAQSTGVAPPPIPKAPAQPSGPPCLPQGTNTVRHGEPRHRTETAP